MELGPSYKQELTKLKLRRLIHTPKYLMPIKKASKFKKGAKINFITNSSTSKEKYNECHCQVV